MPHPAAADRPLLRHPTAAAPPPAGDLSETHQSLDPRGPAPWSGGAGGGCDGTRLTARLAPAGDLSETHQSLDTRGPAPWRGRAGGRPSPPGPGPCRGFVRNPRTPRRTRLCAASPAGAAGVNPGLMSRRFARLIFGLGLLAAGPARAAEERPVFLPTRDVDVTYRVTGGPNTGVELRLAWLAGERKLRVEPPGPAWGILNLASQKLTMVHPGTRSLLELPANALPGGLALPSEPPPGAKFTRLGQRRVAGLACTLWRLDDARSAGASQGETCLTADGVMLRSSGRAGGQSGALEATQVSYARQDPARFRPPADFRPLALPDGLRLPFGGGGGGMPALPEGLRGVPR